MAPLFASCRFPKCISIFRPITLDAFFGKDRGRFHLLLQSIQSLFRYSSKMMTFFKNSVTFSCIGFVLCVSVNVCVCIYVSLKTFGNSVCACILIKQTYRGINPTFRSNLHSSRRPHIGPQYTSNTNFCVNH